MFSISIKEINMLISKEKSNIYYYSEWVGIRSKPYIPILLTVCNNISMKNVVKCVKPVKC